jgi:V-type H+-transporting ATPase subunit a
MGFFALYCGLIYNDFVSLRLNLFGSCYSNKVEFEDSGNKYIKRNDKNCTYSFGLDPIWGIT